LKQNFATAWRVFSIGLRTNNHLGKVRGEKKYQPRRGKGDLERQDNRRRYREEWVIRKRVLKSRARDEVDGGQNGHATGDGGPMGLSLMDAMKSKITTEEKSQPR